MDFLLALLVWLAGPDDGEADDDGDRVKTPIGT
jgi:hypothetical protein